MTTYGYPDCSITHHQKPHFYADLEQKTKDAWKDYEFLTNIIPLPFDELGEQLDKCRDLERRKRNAYDAMVAGLDPELEELEF